MDIVIKNDYKTMHNLEKIKTFSIQDHFIASSKHYKHLENKTLTIEEVLSYPLVLLTNITHGRRNFDNYLDSIGLKIKPSYEFNSYSLCKELIKNGYGIGIGNPIHYKGKNFIILKTNFHLPERFFDICKIKNSDNEILDDFTQLIKNYLN